MFPSGMEWFFVFGVIVLLFGASKLPKVARSMGLSIGKFKEGLKEGKQDAEELEEENESSTPEEDQHLNEEE